MLRGSAGPSVGDMGEGVSVLISGEGTGPSHRAAKSEATTDL